METPLIIPKIAADSCDTYREIETLQKKIADDIAARGTESSKQDRVVVVCGFARSGCTAVMRMLEAGGFPLFPCSPVSYQPDMELAAHGAELFWLSRARGEAVKILEPQRMKFPTGERYDFIYLLRDPHEQAKSQVKFLEFLEQAKPEGERVKMRMGTIPHLADNIQRVRRKVGDTLASFRGARLLALRFEMVMKEPRAAAAAVGEFLGREEFDPEKGAAVIVDRTPWCHPDMLELQFLREALEQGEIGEVDTSAATAGKGPAEGGEE